MQFGFILDIYLNTPAEILFRNEQLINRAKPEVVITPLVDQNSNELVIL